MGGHGGLNILPQKRWNVYNRDNRLKVARDEAKAAAEQAELAERHRQAEAQFRHQQLLRRARARDCAGASGAAFGAELPTEHAQAEEPVAQTAARGDVATRERAAGVGGAAACSDGQTASAAILEHINFWRDLEAREEHPDSKKEQREAARRRGDPKTQTSDAAFDERFGFAHGLGGDKPWYARTPAPTSQQPDAPALEARARPAGGASTSRASSAAAAGGDAHVAAPIGVPHRAVAVAPAVESLDAQILSQLKKLAGRHRSSSKRRHKRRRTIDTRGNSSGDGHSASTSSSASSNSGSSSDGEEGEGRLHRVAPKRKAGRSHSSGKHKEPRKNKHTRKDKDKAKEAHGVTSRRRELQARLDAVLGGGSGGVGSAPGSMEALRAERLAREAAERQRQQCLLARTPAEQGGYNTGYGHAAQLKARPHQQLAWLPRGQRTAPPR